MTRLKRWVPVLGLGVLAIVLGLLAIARPESERAVWVVAAFVFEAAFWVGVFYTWTGSKRHA